MVLGAGPMGSAITHDLLSSRSIESLAVADSDKGRLESCCTYARADRLDRVAVDASSRRSLLQLMENHDVVFGALPAALGLGPAKCAVEAGVNFVDIAFISEDMMTLDADAKAKGVILVPHCGFAPGLGNVLVGHAVSQMDHVERVRILVGGLPREPHPPLEYFLTWSVHSLIDEYSRKCRIVRKGKLVLVDPLSGVEAINVPGAGELECFYTDGLSTLPETLKGVPFMEEKTLRYPGHAEKMRLLSDLGFFSGEPLKIGSEVVIPRKVTAALLSSALTVEDKRDLAVLLVTVEGSKQGKKLTYEFRLVDFYDEASGITAMGRTTGYTASVVGQMIGEGVVDGAGVLPPERIGTNQKWYEHLKGELAKRQIVPELKVAR